MKQGSIISIALLTAVIALAGSAGKASGRLPSVADDTYRKSCGVCHFAYQPGLLPSASWVKIIDEPNAHPGGALPLDEKTIAEVKSYLTRNSAEKSRSKISRKILDSIGSDSPVRISEIPYIKRKHREINQEIFVRKGIGSRANCIACHKSAGIGVYDDDDVVIPG